ncbi:spore germination protein [Paenibacillus amylolyticus]|uniref:spore germination protein n=1 Tax=Paenibacillus amylolyticus TaxID=1451 RepID=UPI003EB8BE75
MVDVLDYRDMPFSTELTVNVDIVKTIYNHSTDIKTRTFPLAGSGDASLLFIDGMVNESLLDVHVLAPLLHARTDKPQIDFAYICSIVTTSQLTIVTSFEDLLKSPSL